MSKPDSDIVTYMRSTSAIQGEIFFNILHFFVSDNTFLKIMIFLTVLMIFQTFFMIFLIFQSFGKNIFQYFKSPALLIVKNISLKVLLFLSIQYR
jgi:hypothetical protein